MWPPGPRDIAQPQPQAVKQITVAALDSILPTIYGSTVPVVGMLANVYGYGAYLAFWVIWGRGPLTAFNVFLMNDVALTGGTTHTDYLGTQTQTYDTLLASLAGGGFTEALHGIAYSVIVVPTSDVTSAPKFAAGVNGRAVYDPRQDSTQSWNKLTYTEAFDNAAWTKTRSSSAAAGSAGGPVGTATLTNFLKEDATAASSHLVNQNAALAASTVYAASVYAKAGGRNFIYINVVDLAGASKFCYFNIAAGVVGSSGGIVSSAITYAGGGWYRCSITVNSATGGGTPTVQIGLASADTVSSYNGDNASGAYLWGAQIEANAAVTTYFPVLTNAAAQTQRLAIPSTWALSDNPALIAADFLMSTVYGDGKTPLWSTVVTTANANDVTEQSEASRTLHMVMDKEQTTSAWAATFATAMNAMIVPQGDVVKFVPDVSGPSVASYAH